MENNDSQNEKNGSNEEKKVSISGTVTVNYNINPINDIVDAINRENTTEGETQRNANTIAEAQVERQRRANNISKVGLFISLCVVGATFLLYFLNKDAVDAAIKAANAAESSLKETKREFNVINEPLLTVSGVVGLSNWRNIDSFSIITFFIHNISTKSVLIEKCIYGLRCNNDNPNDIFTEKDTTNIYVNPSPQYITNNLTYPKLDVFDYRFRNTPSSKKAFKQGKDTFFGVIVYRNYLTDSLKYYIFSVSIAPIKPVGIHRLSRIYLTCNTDKLPSYKSKKYNEFLKN